MVNVVLWLPASQFRWIYSWSQPAWSKGRWLPGTCATFVKWTGWTLAVAVPLWQHCKHCHIVITFASTVMIHCRKHQKLGNGESCRISVVPMPLRQQRL